MVSLIENCTVDVIYEIISHLEPDAIRNLRLSCKTLAIKSSSSYHVKALFQSKHVELTEQALRACADIARGGDAPRRTRQGRVQLWRKNKDSLLNQSFIALKRNGLTGRLASLSLEVAVLPDLKASLQQNARAVYDWRPLSEAAVDTFHTTFRALATSQLRIESLNMFNGPGQQRCSLPCNALSGVDWDGEGLTESLSSMRSLSISLSSRVSKFDEDEDRHVITDNGTTRRSRIYHHDNEDVSIAQDERNFTGLASFFQLLKNLESFELHYFRRRGELQGLPSPMDWRHDRLLQRLVTLNSLPNLTRSTLRGIYATESDLLAFIKRTRVSELSLENVILSSGTFRSIFDYCTSAATSITKLNFDVLYEMGSQPRPMVMFLGPRRSRFGYDEVGLGSESLERGGDDINQPISYHTPILPPIRSPVMSSFVAFQRVEYGNIN
ncbi:hypothetical protein V500_08507 [Pseudogymnoascus sp. VKM F-4518 (FW-2643)]|nr:hypothetical protein V500_08507 [Pseudogymnoascus sp. VKM F-4518 (FW-2643)]